MSPWHRKPQSCPEQTLDDVLRVYPSDNGLKGLIAQGLWGVDSPDASQLNAYFRHYTDQNDQYLHDFGLYVSVRCHRDILSIVRLLKEHMKREQIVEVVRQNSVQSGQPVEDQRIEASIDLAIRVLCMVKTGRVPKSYISRKELEWKHGSLREFLTSQFCRDGTLKREHVKLEKLFVAVNLERIAGLRIHWTSNLANHLRMMEQDTEVAIFHQCSVLPFLQSCNLLPSGLVEETIQSLALLFPQSDLGTHKWFETVQKEQKDSLDPKVIGCGFLQAEDRHIDNFHYWRDRIVILKQVFDESKPRSWKQWWYDTRNGHERYPILLAAIALVFTAFFGMVQGIAGIMQAYKAYHPSKMGRL